MATHQQQQFLVCQFVARYHAPTSQKHTPATLGIKFGQRACIWQGSMSVDSTNGWDSPVAAEECRAGQVLVIISSSWDRDPVRWISTQTLISVTCWHKAHYKNSPHVQVCPDVVCMYSTFHKYGCLLCICRLAYVFQFLLSAREFRWRLHKHRIFCLSHHAEYPPDWHGCLQRALATIVSGFKCSKGYVMWYIADIRSIYHMTLTNLLQELLGQTLNADSTY